MLDLTDDLTDDFNRRYMLDPPPYQPKYRCCGKCGGTEQEDPIEHAWDCLNPECKSHEMKRKIDTMLISMYGTSTPLTDSRRAKRSKDA